MKQLLCIVLIGGMIVCAACSSRRAACTRNEALERFRSVDEVKISQGADSAFNEGDKRLLGVRTVGLYVPSFTGDPSRYRYGIRVIDGTSDTPCDKDEADHNKNAARYSAIYNKEMLRRIALGDK